VLPGIPVDGGTQSVDGGSDELLVDSPEAFVVRLGAAQRYVARVRPLGRGFEAWTALPGGQSGVPGDRFHANLLERWLTNESHPLRQRRAELVFGYASVETVLPAKDQ
jgi:acyl-homoserine lactone acylase PvdQ